MAKQTVVKTKEKISVENIFLTVTLATASSMVLGVSLAGLLFVSEKPNLIATLRNMLQTNAINQQESVRVQETVALLKEGVSADGMEAGLDNVNDLGAVLDPRVYQDANNIPDIDLKESVLAVLADVENYFTVEYQKFTENCFVAALPGETRTCFYWDENLTAMSDWYRDVFALIDGLSADIAAINTADDLNALDMASYKEQYDGLVRQYQAIQADRLYDVTNMLQALYADQIMNTMYHVKANDTDTKKGVYQNLEAMEAKARSEIGEIDSTVAQLAIEIDSKCSTTSSTRPKVINTNTASICDALKAQSKVLEEEKVFYEEVVLSELTDAKNITYDAQPANFYGKAAIANQKMTEVKDTLRYLKIQDDGSYPVVTFAVYWNGGEMIVDDATVIVSGMAKDIEKLADAALATSESLLYLHDGVVAADLEDEVDVVPYLDAVTADVLATSGSWEWDLDRLSVIAASVVIKTTVNDQVIPALQQIIDLFDIASTQVETATETPATPTLPSPELNY